MYLHVDFFELFFLSKSLSASFLELFFSDFVDTNLHPLFLCHTDLLLNSLTFPFHCLDQTFPVIELAKQASPLTLHISCFFSRPLCMLALAVPSA